MSENISVLHPALKNWDELPASTLVPIQVICTIYSCSPATVWRRVRSGQLVAPHRIGSRTTRWMIGDIRAALLAASMASGSATRGGGVVSMPLDKFAKNEQDSRKVGGHNHGIC